MRTVPFTRPTLIAAVELLELHTQAKFNQTVLRLGLEDEIPSDNSLSVAKKCDLLGRATMKRAGMVVNTVDGSMTLGEAVIREAVQLAQHNVEQQLQTAFARGLGRDGYVIVFDDSGQNPSIRAALPAEIHLSETDDEIHELLKQLNFAAPLGHLDQAIDAHTRGDWAACNGQLRTFLESLFDDIARKLRPAEMAKCSSSENRRALLAEIKFFVIDRKEWTQDGKNYLNGLFKMLHTEGAHPGLSDEDQCTFRLHVVIVTARTFLRRLTNYR